MSDDVADGDGGSDGGGLIPWRTTALYVILAVSLVVPLDVPFVSPVLPVVAGAFEVSDARASLLITAFSAPGAVTTILLGIAADRFGRRPVLVPCLAGYGLFGVGIGLVGVVGFDPPVGSTFDVVLALRFLQGIAGGGILATIALTLVGDFFAGPRRNAVMGLTTGVTVFGASLYPALGGTLAEIDWYLPFLVYAGAIPVSAFAFFALSEPDIDRSGSTGLRYFRDTINSIPGGVAGLLYGATLFSAILSFGGIFAAVTFMLEVDYGLSPGRIGLYVTGALLVAAALSVSNGWIARHVGNRTLIATGFVGYGVGFSGLWFAAAPVEVLLPLFVVGVAHGLVLPTLPSELSALAPGEFRGGVLSVRTSLILVGQAVGPPLFTIPAATLGYQVPLLVGGLAAGASGVVALLATRAR